MDAVELPHISIVIPTYNRGEYLVQTLKQVLAQRRPGDEVLVIDQTRRNESDVERYLNEQAMKHRIRWLRQQRPDLQTARNRGLLEAAGQVVLYVDDDVVLPTGFLDAHRRNYADPRVAGVAGKVISPLTPDNAEDLPQRRPGGARFDCLHLRLDGSRRIEGVANWIGANFSARRKDLLEIGGHDQAYVGTCFNEVDSAVRLWKAGKSIVYDPHAWLRHLMAPTGGQGLRPRTMAPWKHYFGSLYFLRRHVFPSRQYWIRIFKIFFRGAVFTRNTMRRPWLIPCSIVAYFYAFALAMVRAPKTIDGETPANFLAP